jgi:hypothetical protein
VSEFAHAAASGCADHAALGTLLAVELGHPNGPWVDGRLHGLARQVPRGAPEAELSGLGALLARRFEPSAEGALVLPDALATGVAHPAALAIAGAGVAHRAGVSIGLVGNGRRLYLAHELGDEPLVLDPMAPRTPVDGRRLGMDLLWRCAHESTYALLDHLMERAAAQRDVTTMEACTLLRRVLALAPRAHRG